MALWKPFLGTRAALDTVEKHPGYVYWCADDGSLHFDYTDADGNLQRKQINAKDCESIMGISLDELKAHIANQDIVVLAESQAYTDQAIEAIKADATTQDAVVLHEAQAYTDTALAQAKESGDLKGEKGDSGYTPVRGTDYWTESDKAEIKAYVDDAILNGAW